MRYPRALFPSNCDRSSPRWATWPNGSSGARARSLRLATSTRPLALAVIDDDMDFLHRQLFHAVLSEDWQHGVEAAIDVTLVSRYYERFADHAVTIGKRVVHIVTGEPYSTAGVE